LADAEYMEMLEENDGWYGFITVTGNLEALTTVYRLESKYIMSWVCFQYIQQKKISTSSTWVNLSDFEWLDRYQAESSRVKSNIKST
jgi:hypothetical protein